MSEETPRLSRRQMREQGLLDEPTDTPPVYDTTELRLRRPSRKELRELAQREAAEQAPESAEAADSVDPEDVGEPTQAMEAVKAPEPVQHERKSVFDRFEADEPAEDKPEEEPAAEVTKPAEPVPAAEPEPAGEAEQAEPEVDLDDEPEDSLRDRFLAMTSRGEETGEAAGEAADEPAHATAPVPAPVAEKTPAPKPADETKPAADVVADDPAPDTEVEAPRRTWLNFIILVLIAAIVGYLGGSWINMTFLSEPMPGVVNDFSALLL